MAVDKKLRARYYRRCDPSEPVSTDDERYVALDAARGRDWVGALATRIELSEAPVCELFTGLRGSGKTTELRRLSGLLEGARFLPVLIDAGDVLDLYETLDVPDLLIAVLAEAERHVLAAEGEKGSAPAPFWQWLIETEAELKSVQADASAGLGGKLVLEMKTRPRLRDKVRETLRGQLGPFIARIHGAFVDLDARARAAGYQGLAVIVDSLEKLWGTSSTWREVIDSAERVFSGQAALLRLPVHVVYSIPTSLTLRMTSPVAFLPMLELHDREGQRAAGFDLAREMVRRRVPDAVLDEFFGAQGREERVGQLIELSGGSPRELVRLLQSCVAEPEMSDKVFAFILAGVSAEYRRTVLGSEVPLLARLAVEKQLPLDPGSRDTVDRLFQNGVILAYQDGARWYDVNPAVGHLQRGSSA